jgi:hypothetical protein
MNTVPVDTPHGVIYGRNALLLKSQDIDFSPLAAKITCSLSRAGCIPEILNKPDVDVTFSFTDIKRFSIYKLDDYPHEQYSSSSFDRVQDEKVGARYVLSTYDYVFDIVGKLGPLLWPKH